MTTRSGVRAGAAGGGVPPADSPSPPDVPETDSTLLDPSDSTTASDDAPEHTA